MSMYRARWTCPATGRKLFQDFHSKPEAEAFCTRPRPVPVQVLVQRLGDVRP